MDLRHVSRQSPSRSTGTRPLHISVSGVYFLCVLLFLSETRSDIILTRLARKMRKTKQDDRYRAKAEIDKRSLFTLIKISSMRPISACYLLNT